MYSNNRIDATIHKYGHRTSATVYPRQHCSPTFFKFPRRLQVFQTSDQSLLLWQWLTWRFHGFHPFTAAREQCDTTHYTCRPTVKPSQGFNSWEMGNMTPHFWRGGDINTQETCFQPWSCFGHLQLSFRSQAKLRGPTSKKMKGIERGKDLKMGKKKSIGREREREMAWRFYP